MIYLDMLSRANKKIYVHCGLYLLREDLLNQLMISKVY